MAYSKSTEFYHLPVMGYGDAITEEEEMRQMTIIDSLLYASTFGSSKCVIEEGGYSVREDADGGCRLVVSPKEGGVSLMGILNYRLFMSPSEVESTAFHRGDETFFYACYSESLDSDYRDFSVRGFSARIDDSDPQFLYLARVWFEGGSARLETDVGKVYGKNILAHTADSTNPHGRILHQDSIEVHDALSVNGNRVFGAVYGEVPAPGPRGVEVSVPKGFSAVFLTAFASSPEGGQVSWRKDGERVLLFNSGNAGGTISFKMEVRRK